MSDQEAGKVPDPMSVEPRDSRPGISPVLPSSGSAQESKPAATPDPSSERQTAPEPKPAAAAPDLAVDLDADVAAARSAAAGAAEELDGVVCEIHRLEVLVRSKQASPAEEADLEAYRLREQSLWDELAQARRRAQELAAAQRRERAVAAG